MQSQHISKFKKHLKHLLSIALAFTLSLSTPLTTLAANGDVQDSANNTGGGSGSMSTTTSALAWSANAQGYRIYIIDRNFQRISPVYDFLYSTPSGPIGDELYTTRFDGPTSPTGPTGHYKAPITKLQEWCDSSETPPPPTVIESGIRVGNGQKFKEWFFAGGDGFNLGNSTSPSGFSFSLSSGASYPRTTITQRINSNDYSTAVECEHTGELRALPSNAITSSRYYEIINAASKIEEKADIYYTIFQSDIGKWIDTNGDGTGDYQLTSSTLQSYCEYKAYKSYESTYTSASLSSAMFIVQCGRSAFDQNVEVIFYSGGMSAHTPTQNLLTQSIPLSGGTGGTGGDGTPTPPQSPTTPTPTTPRFPAYYLVNKDDTIRVPGYDNAALALQDNCYMVVEPITWLYVRTTNGAWDNPSSYESTRTYGTFWNLANKWNSTAGFYNTIMTKLFNNCLTTTTTTTSPTGAVIHGITDALNQRSIANSVELMNQNYGLSMHLYQSKSKIIF